MKSEKNILIAFILNLFFSVLELGGGVLTGSIAILSDALHDIGDALGIGVAYFLEKKSKNGPDEIYTYGYKRYSLIGGAFTTTILIIGSVAVISGAINRLINPVKIHYDGMIVFGILGVLINTLAAVATHGEGSFNRKAVNLHMIEDVLGWIVVLIGAVVMKFTGFYIIDGLLSIGVALFILIHALRNLKYIADVVLEKTPDNINMEDIKRAVLDIDGVRDVHHIHLWSIDGYYHCATMHIVIDEYKSDLKHQIRNMLEEKGIGHITLEFETSDEMCSYINCCAANENNHTHTHHTHHNHEH